MRAGDRQAVLLLVSGLLALAVFAAFAYFVRRHYFLCDDAFISFRYARHLTEGLGLVWNVGDRVEGYSNFLWVLLMAAGIAVGIGPEQLAPGIGILSGGAVLVLMAKLGARRSGWRDPWIWLVPGLLALNRSFAAWSSGGLETQFVSLLVLAGYLSLIDERRDGTPWPWISSVLLAAAALTRADGGLYAIPAGLCMAAEVARKRCRFRSLMLWALPIALIVGSHVAWRFFYYGDFLPNTYYAKVGGFSWERSRFYLDSFFSGYHLYGFVPLGVVAVWVRRDFTSALFATAVAANLAYLTWIGGDFLEYRFLVPILPYLYWLVVDGVRAIAALEIGDGWKRVVPRGAAAAVGSALFAATILGSASDQTWSVGRGIEGVAASRFYAEVRIGQGRLLRSLIDGGALPRELRWQTRGAGAVPYYTGWYTLDTLGLNDRYVARQPLRSGSHGRVGHERHAPLEYSRAKKVQLLPVGQQFLFTVPEKQVAELKRGFEKTWKASAGGERESVVHCRKVVPGAYLFFRTTVSDAELESLFGGLERC